MSKLRSMTASPVAYRIDAGLADAYPSDLQVPVATIVLVGCGGTGSFLAEALCRLLIGRNASLWLVDLDRVEHHNVARQAYDPADIGRFKAEVLAERLSRRFGREIGYAVAPYDPSLHAEVFAGPARLRLLIGAVDNAQARRDLASTLERGGGTWAARVPPGAVWWLDCGNGRDSGQVLLGNGVRSEQLRGAFSRQDGLCCGLPAPNLQRPDLLLSRPEPSPRPHYDCAEAVALGDQGPTINQVVAAVSASFIEKLLVGTCTWMASYFDMQDGMLRCVPADPKTVARLTSLHPGALQRRAA